MAPQNTADVLNTQRKVAEGMPYHDEPFAAAQESPAKAREMFKKGGAKWVEMEEGFERYVQTKPVQSMLIAAGAGVLVGYLFGRRR